MKRTLDRILVPTDFSPHSAEALQVAATIGERFSSTLSILHVISKDVEEHAMHAHLGYRSSPLLGYFSETPEVPADVQETITIDLRDRARTAIQEFIPSDLKYQPLEFLVAVGVPYEQILQTATDQDADLIVMGTHGRTGLFHTLLGSVAERVLRLAACPVLTVKATPPSSSGG